LYICIENEYGFGKNADFGALERYQGSRRDLKQ